VFSALCARKSHDQYASPFLQFGLVYLTPAGALRRCVASKSQTGVDVAAALAGGGVVSDELVADAISQTVSTFACRSRGWVLDGFPTTAAQAALLVRAGVVPHEVISLDGDAAAAAAAVAFDVVALRSRDVNSDAYLAAKNPFKVGSECSCDFILCFAVCCSLGSECSCDLL
jgi:hypothetical protein